MVLFILFCLVVGCYVVSSLALAKIAKLNGQPKCYGWIPILNISVIFKVGGANPKLAWFYLAYIIILFIATASGSLFLGFIALILSLITTILSIYQYVLIYRVGKIYDMSVALFVISVIVPFVMCVYLYKLSKAMDRRTLSNV